MSFWNSVFWQIILDDPELPSEIIELPPPEIKPSTPCQEHELQSCSLDANSLLGLLIVLTIWTVFDIAHKVYLLIRREYRRRYKVRSVRVPATPPNTPVSDKRVHGLFPSIVSRSAPQLQTQQTRFSPLSRALALGIFYLIQ